MQESLSPNTSDGRSGFMLLLCRVMLLVGRVVLLAGTE